MGIITFLVICQFFYNYLNRYINEYEYDAILDKYDYGLRSPTYCLNLIIHIQFTSQWYFTKTITIYNYFDMNTICNHVLHEPNRLASRSCIGKSFVH